MLRIPRRLFPRAPLLAHLRLAYHRRRVALHAHVRYACQAAQLARLQRYGLVAHYEWDPTCSGQRASRGGARRVAAAPEHKLWLRYRQLAPARSPAFQAAPTRRVSYAALARFEAQGGGGALLVMTFAGVLTHRECLQRRCGGCVVGRVLPPMRFSACYKLVGLRGFFWPLQFFSYRRRWAGYRSGLGGGRWLRRLSLVLGDGAWGRGYTRRPARVYPQRRIRAQGFALLRVLTPHLSPVWPWAWAVLRQLRVRGYRGHRYRLGLPSRGQRTRSNAVTVGRVADPAAEHVRHTRWVRRIWEARRRPAIVVRVRRGARVAPGKKAERVSAAHVRRLRAAKQKKKDPWR
jgi:ribosomal protein S8